MDLLGVQGANLTGKRFGKLIALEKVRIGYSKYKWRCVCDCGNEHFVNTYHLLHGDVKSCGCERFKACVTHGMTETRLYHIWCTMKARCLRPTSQKYERYGGRGITVCDEWRDDFTKFYDWAVSNGYRDDLSIDRINNDDGYYPENCRWATAEQQANNTSANRFIEYKGEKLTIRQASKKYGVEYRLLLRRLWRGWDVERAIETPKITKFLGEKATA